MLIVATELHVKSFWNFFEFLKHSGRSIKQAKRMPGVISVKASIKGWRIGYTLTFWENKEAMHSFRNSGAHKIAMTKTRKLCSRYKIFAWEAARAPSFEEAKRILAGRQFTVLK
ncbi:MAG TPA: hypothetical protein VMZ03_12995 [Chitinophagaceae bacterium]|nr:hypothetical protein [Chitinophagaceae bacterium]